MKIDCKKPGPFEDEDVLAMERRFAPLSFVFTDPIEALRAFLRNRLRWDLTQRERIALRTMAARRGCVAMYDRVADEAERSKGKS